MDVFQWREGAVLMTVVCCSETAEHAKDLPPPPLGTPPPPPACLSRGRLARLAAQKAGPVAPWDATAIKVRPMPI